MIPVIDALVRKFSLKDLVVVADAGLMSSKNIELLKSAQDKYVIGARIKNDNVKIRD